MSTRPDDIIIRVLGIPCPKGSKSGYIVNRYDPPNARVVIVEGSSDSGRKAYKLWVKAVKDELREWRSMFGEIEPMIDCAVFVRLNFFLHRPPSVPVRKRPWPQVKPDIDKLTRGVYDCLTGLVIIDDALIVADAHSKDYAYDDEPPGVRILIRRMSSRT